MSRSRSIRLPLPGALASGAILLLLLALAAAGPPPALAGPNEDFLAVYNDWKPDGDVASCRFTRAQLVNARNVAAGIQDFDSYAPGFRDEVGREIARYDSGGCSGISPDTTARNSSPLRRVRITRISPKGGKRESVTIRNRGSRSVSLRGATLRDRRGNRIRFPRSTRLRAGRSLKVITGCARGRRRPFRRGSLFWACRRKLVWDDRGDVVKLVDSRRTVVTQRGYGTYRGVRRF